MRQILYYSDSLIGKDLSALDRLTVQARNNNAIDGITGLLWTDGHRFAQAIEGDRVAIGELLTKIVADPRHCNFIIVQDAIVGQRLFGDWSMTRLGDEAHVYAQTQRVRHHLMQFDSVLSTTFQQVLAGAGLAHAI